MKRCRKRRNRYSCLDCGVNTDVIGAKGVLLDWFLGDYIPGATP